MLQKNNVIKSKYILIWLVLLVNNTKVQIFLISIKKRPKKLIFVIYFASYIYSLFCNLSICVKKYNQKTNITMLAYKKYTNLKLIVKF